MKARITQLASALAVLGLLPHSAISADTLTVCAAGCDWTTIQGAVNAAAPGDTVLIADSVHTEADILVFTSVSIEGVPGSTTVQAAGQPELGQGRVLTVAAGTTVHLRDLTLRHGDTADRGGAVQNFGTLTLERIELSLNRSGLDGGAVYNEGALSIEGCEIAENRSSSGDGGGVFNAEGGQLQVSDCSFDDNRALLGDGGHLYNFGDATAVQTLFFAGVAATSGGAIYNRGDLVVSGSFYSNYVGAGGGAIDQRAGSLVVRDAEFVVNSTAVNGGALRIAGGSAWVESATFQENAALRGGGIYIGSEEALTVVNSTLSGNSARGSGGAVYIGPSARLDLASATVVDNVADLDEDGSGDGGGIVLVPCAGLCSATKATLESSIVANNEDRSPPGAFVADDCYGELTSLGFNLVEGAATLGPCIVDGDLTGVQVGIDPDLDTLGNHGGPEVSPGTVPDTVPPNPGSPVIDAGDPLGCTDPEGSSLPRDQRGAFRVGVCDLGSFEYEGVFPLFADGFESGDTTAWDPL